MLVVVLGFTSTNIMVWQGCKPRPEEMALPKSPEELVCVRSRDDVINCGALFTPLKDSTKSIAVIWIHGWGANFYHPSYVQVGRFLTEHGYTCISVNTRMHDIGFNIGQTKTMRIRGGGYWGVASEQVHDLAAWIDFAEDRGFQKVVLVGHSAGWSAVRRYQAEMQDSRVVGIVLASGQVYPDLQSPDKEMLAEATRLVSEGHGDELLRIPNRRFSSFISAATFLDNANNPPEFKDFFGVKIQNPGITRIQCPLLAWFGSRGDVGDEAALEQLKSCIQRQSKGPSHVKTVMIRGADHMYTGKENKVARILAEWVNSL